MAFTAAPSRGPKSQSSDGRRLADSPFAAARTPRRVIQRSNKDPRLFNRVCAAAALVWLLAVGAEVRILRPTLGDFPQFYMGGTIALNRAWPDLYPIPT